jgi:hypothetical protein
LLERRPSTGPNVGIFVGILTFHIGLSYWKITSNFNKVTAGAPAASSVSVGPVRFAKIRATFRRVSETSRHLTTPDE